LPDERSSSDQNDYQVLHVDDNTDHLEITWMHIEDIVSSIEVTGATTPKAALKLLEEQIFDCIIMDYKMPEMDGIELARRIRETSDVPIIIYTGQGSEEVAEAAFASGVDDYLRKEQGYAHFTVFAKRIQSLVERHQSRMRSQRFNERIGTLHVNAANLALAQNLEEVAGSTYNSMRNVIGFELCGFTIVDEGLLKLIHPIPESGEPIVRPLSGKGISNRAVKTGESQLINDVLQDDDYVPWGREGPIRSALDVPVKIEGRVVAMLSAASSMVGAFSEEDQKLMQTLATHVSSALFRIQQREALRESEERFRLFAEASLDTVVSLNKDRRVNYVSPSVERILGYTPGEVLGKTLDDFIEPSEVSKAMHGLDGVVNGDSDSRLQFNVVSKDGFVVPVEYSFMLLQRDGEKIGSLGVLRDVSDQMKLEYALRGSERRWRAFVDLAPIGIITLNLKGYITSINQAFCTLTGFSIEEIVGKHITMLDTAKASDLPKYWKLFLSSIKGEAPQPIELLFRRKDGTTGWCDAKTRLIEIDGKRELMAIVRDISERKRLEEELTSYTEALERSVDERSREAMEAERRADLGRIAAMVGHDLRGPIVTILNALQMIRIKPERSDRLLQIIENNANRGIDMLEGLSERLRDTPINPELTDLGILIRTTIEDIMIPDNVKPVLRIDDDIGSIMIDAPQIRRVLDNLIRNALDSMLAGGELTIAAYTLGDEVFVEVSDTGVGIHEEQMRRLYEPFYSSKPDGLGIGLYYCKQTLAAHGGSIDVESEMGKGTSFIVTLPQNSMSAT
jgi:PAS domain S-box-containing protein